MEAKWPHVATWSETYADMGNIFSYLRPQISTEVNGAKLACEFTWNIDAPLYYPGRRLRRRMRRERLWGRLCCGNLLVLVRECSIILRLSHLAMLVLHVQPLLLYNVRIEMRVPSITSPVWSISDELDPLLLDTDVFAFGFSHSQLRVAVAA